MATAPIVWSDLDSALALNGQGDINIVTNNASARQSSEQIVGTMQGERPMRVMFGSALNSFVFDLNNNMNSAAMAQAIKMVVESWDARVIVDRIDITRKQAEKTVLIKVSLSIAGVTDVFTVERTIS